MKFRVRCAAALVAAATLSPAHGADCTRVRSCGSTEAFAQFHLSPEIDLTRLPGAVSLKAGAARGSLESPPIDAAREDSTPDAIAPFFRIRSLAIDWRTLLPGAASARIEGRSGATPCPDSSWSAWTTIDQIRPARFVQVRAQLEAGQDALPPALTRLTVAASGECVTDPDTFGYRQLDTPSESRAVTQASRRTRLILTCAETPGHLSVWAVSGDPAIASFRFSPAGGEPVTISASIAESGFRQAAFLWTFPVGLHSLSVTPIDAASREFDPATVQLDWQPPKPETP